MQKHIWWRLALLAGAAWVVGACFHSETSCGQSCTCVPSESGDSGKGHVTNTAEELVSGTADSSRTDRCPTGCIPCSNSNFTGWLSLDSSGEGKVSSLLLLSGERGEQLTDGVFP